METTLTTLNVDGGQAGTVQLDAAWLEAEKGAQAVKDSVVAFMASLRAGTAATKTRGMVRGGGRKPYKQKGTGRARAGSIRSPVWRGGGVTFGPQPRSYTKKMNRSSRRLALKRAFTERLAEGSVILLDALELAEPKTQGMVALLERIGAGQDALVVMDEPTENVAKAAGNLPGVAVMKASSINPYWLLLFKKIVFTKAALAAFGKRLVAQEVVE
ncbi:MAG: 50S ribosomal protein L4 [Lentisphaeria bacterium]|jgi:large subunit ribosomal protein L4